MLYFRVTFRILLLAVSTLLVRPILSQEIREQFADKFDEADDIVNQNPDRAIKLMADANALVEDSEDLWIMGMSLAGMGYISYEVGDFRSSLLNYMKALKVIQSADTTDLSNEIIILNELSRIHSEFNNHDESIKYGKAAWGLAKLYARKHKKHAVETGQISWLVDIPYYIAIEYQAKGAHKTAGEILFELWEKAEDKKDIYAYSQVLNELGLIKLNNAEYTSSQEYLGLVVSSSDVDDWDKSMAYHNLAASYSGLGEYEKAKGYYLIALEIKQTLGEPEAEFITMLDLGELELEMGNNSVAIGHWESALEIYSDIETDPELYNIYNLLQLAYMDIDINKAKEYNLKHTQLNDFYVKNQSVQRELEAQNRDELSSWIDQQRQERVDAEQRQQFIKQFWPVFLGVGLLIIFSMIIGVRYLRTVRANKALAQKQMSVTAVHTREEAA